MDKKAIIYIYISLQTELNKHDSNFQLKACSEYAKQNGYVIFEPAYIDDVRQKDPKDTRELARVLEYLLTNKDNVSSMIIYNSALLPSDKYTRSILFADFKNEGFKIISVTEGEIELKTNVFLQILRYFVNHVSM